MSALTFLASSRPFYVPDDLPRLYVDEVEPLEYVSLKQGRFTMSYLYTIDGADQWEFMIYLERYMEEGDVLELLYIENQNDSMHDHLPSAPLVEPIDINIQQRTYQTIHGTFQLSANDWMQELYHRSYLTAFGVTTIVKY
ncbi:hypothetical protein RCC94_02240 [Exiguobacterium acetylicum]|uniref:hypothetical protein n=1 Tax=Exiguobacterium TaxID=33986 RepID=UPI0004480216|nr:MULTISPECIES: hypothetical protein [Exiguobacterium]EZP61670.1 hypothetical protein BW42_01341 [Exiguobacterium sp. RIT341]KQS44959.1 hypothetical protein ASG02_02665 [Exiguobacterium sp. Leaf196]MDQ6466286.1 hypothetical protein [Exiguobacterium acetylicum]HAB33277.1 hypothetical protein [Exiguobacterium sp.]